MKTKKHFTGLLGISIITMFFFSCGSSNSTISEFVFEKNPPFTLHTVWFQNWVAGVQSGDSGTYFYFSVSEVKENVTFKEIYFRKKTASVRSVSETENNNYTANFLTEKRDVIMSDNPQEEAKNIPPKTFEFPLKEKEAVISFLYNNKLYYYKIEDIIQKNTLNYPASNPNMD